MRISIWRLARESVSGWVEDKVSRHAAALAFYTIFSLAPLVVIAVAMVGLVFGEDAAEGRLVGEIGALVGPDSAQAIQSMVAEARQPSDGVLATVVGVVVLVIGATTVFAQLQDSLDEIWGVKPRPGRPVRGILRARATSFALVLAVGFILLVSLVASAAVSAATSLLGRVLPMPGEVLHAINFAVSFSLTALLFAAIFKVLPDVEIGWRDVWVGAVVTALLFSIGRFLIGLYLGRGSVASAYGAAGSFVVILFWVYYSAQILFLGAEFTRVYAERYGSHIEPSPGAVPIRQGEEGCTTERTEA